ncbi:hypothetical protein K440DRAFT_626808 [Wilcoxina mikolae CBS 423.85]|nr:hypothetical protein K440DRAFT_626808 [Wilcoxina mikolae CBS 423.85]
MGTIRAKSVSHPKHPAHVAHTVSKSVADLSVLILLYDVLVSSKFKWIPPAMVVYL